MSGRGGTVGSVAPVVLRSNEGGSSVGSGVHQRHPCSSCTYPQNKSEGKRVRFREKTYEVKPIVILEKVNKFDDARMIDASENGDFERDLPSSKDLIPVRHPLVDTSLVDHL